MASKDSLDKADTATWPHIHPISSRVCKRHFYFLVVVLVMEPSTLYMLGKRSTTATLPDLSESSAAPRKGQRIGGRRVGRYAHSDHYTYKQRYVSIFLTQNFSHQGTVPRSPALPQGPHIQI